MVIQKFDRESGVDCPNAILVLLLHIQELWMDIMPPTPIDAHSMPYSSDQLRKQLNVM